MGGEGRNKGGEGGGGGGWGGGGFAKMGQVLWLDREGGKGGEGREERGRLPTKNSDEINDR